LLFVFAHCHRSRRKLQYRCLLALAERGQEHDLSVGKLQRVVMHMRRLFIELAEDRRRVLEVLYALPEESGRLDHNLPGKRDFGSGKQAYGSVTIFRGAEASCSSAEVSRG